MSDEKDPPIEEPGFLGGVRVIDIGDARVARGLSRRAHSSCPHRHLRYDASERRIWCADCERDVEGYDAFVVLVEQFHKAASAAHRREVAVAEAEKHALVSLAAKAVDGMWRGRRMVPTCPVCGHGLFPEDFKSGIGLSLGRAYGAARRAKANKPVPGYDREIRPLPDTRGRQE